MRRKVTVVGSGNVGATAGQRIAESGLADVVLIDVLDGVAKGKALDLLQSGPVMHYDTRLMGTCDYADTKGSDVVVVTAGVARKPGMSRDDLLNINFDIVKKVTKQIVENSHDCIIIMVTNPLDVMAYTSFKVSGFSRERVVGMAGVLDSARFRTFIAMEMGCSIENIHAFVLGGHGDDMVPLPRYSTVAGVPITELLPADKVKALVDRTRNGGAEIVKYLQTGSAYYAPAASIYDMVDSILNDRKKILPCSVYLKGEYGISDTFAGIPAILGSKGMERIFEIKLTKEEQESFNESAAHVKQSCDKLSF